MRYYLGLWQMATDLADFAASEVHELYGKLTITRSDLNSNQSRGCLT